MNKNPAPAGPRNRVFHELLDHLPDPVLLIDPRDGRIIDVNWACCNELGYARQEMLALRIYNIDAAINEELFLSAVNQLRETPSLVWEGLHERKDGSSFPAEVKLRYVRLQQDYILAAARNITERRRMEQSLREETHRRQILVDQSRDGIVVMEENGKVYEVNRAFADMLGYTQDELLHMHLWDWEHNFPRAQAEEMMRAVDERGHHFETRHTRKDGSVIDVELSTNATRINNRKLVFAISRDITERKQAEQLIWRQANFDQLTGLPNRRMFLDRLNEEIKKSRRSGLPLALLFLDLDHFKRINDSLGHDMGDLLLQQTAERLRECVRESDTIARLSGDEFTLILSNLSDSDRVGAIAQKILWKLAAPFTLGGEQAYISGSIGITLYPADASDAEGLLKNADQAMYDSKKAGRGRYQYFTPAMQDAALRRIRLSNELRDAIERGELTVVYQPIHDLRTGRIAQAEALVHWQHPESGSISPAEFIPLAEECGLIGSIGDLLFHDVVRNCKDWLELQSEIRISFGTSPAQFNGSGRDGRMAAWLRLLQEQQVPGSSIVVEIPERLLLDARPEIARQLVALRDAGVALALDDFGTGYSSLTCLRKFDIDYLKIDPSFIRELKPDSEEYILCTAIITMAHNLGLQVVAEGVETAEQAMLLKELACDYVQGFHYASAMNAAEFRHLLQQQG